MPRFSRRKSAVLCTIANDGIKLAQGSHVFGGMGGGGDVDGPKSSAPRIGAHAGFSLVEILVGMLLITARRLLAGVVVVRTGVRENQRTYSREIGGVISEATARGSRRCRLHGRLSHGHGWSDDVCESMRDVEPLEPAECSGPDHRERRLYPRLEHREHRWGHEGHGESQDDSGSRAVDGPRRARAHPLRRQGMVIR